MTARTERYHRRQSDRHHRTMNRTTLNSIDGYFNLHKNDHPNTLRAIRRLKSDVRTDLVKTDAIAEMVKIRLDQIRHEYHVLARDIDQINGAILKIESALRPLLIQYHALLELTRAASQPIPMPEPAP